MDNRSRITGPVRRREFLMGDVVVSQWRQLRHELLRQRTDRLAGPPTDSDERSAIRFTVTQLPLPDGGITVTLDPVCGLADVLDLCVWVSQACLDDDPSVIFTRAAPSRPRPMKPNDERTR